MLYLFCVFVKAYIDNIITGARLFEKQITNL